MSADRAERCDLCRWWEHEKECWGRCHRYAPQTTNDEDETVWWPNTLSVDWCGEFRPRDPRGFPQ